MCVVSKYTEKESFCYRDLCPNDILNLFERKNMLVMYERVLLFIERNST